MHRKRQKITPKSLVQFTRLSWSSACSPTIKWDQSTCQSSIFLTKREEAISKTDSNARLLFQKKTNSISRFRKFAFCWINCQIQTSVSSQSSFWTTSVTHPLFWRSWWKWFSKKVLVSISTLMSMSGYVLIFSKSLMTGRIMRWTSKNYWWISVRNNFSRC